jgi:hypothetical protein
LTLAGEGANSFFGWLGFGVCTLVCSGYWEYDFCESKLGL